MNRKQLIKTFMVVSNCLIFLVGQKSYMYHSEGTSTVCVQYESNYPMLLTQKCGKTDNRTAGEDRISIIFSYLVNKHFFTAYLT